MKFQSSHIKEGFSLEHVIILEETFDWIQPVKADSNGSNILVDPKNLSKSIRGGKEGTGSKPFASKDILFNRSSLLANIHYSRRFCLRFSDK